MHLKYYIWWGVDPLACGLRSSPALSLPSAYVLWGLVYTFSSIFSAFGSRYSNLGRQSSPVHPQKPASITILRVLNNNGPASPLISQLFILHYPSTKMCWVVWIDLIQIVIGGGAIITRRS